MPDIPIVTEPDYPERIPTIVGGSIFTRTHGTNERSKLAVAPLLDVSSSGADDGFYFCCKKKKKNNTSKCVSYLNFIYFCIRHTHKKKSVKKVR